MAVWTILYAAEKYAGAVIMPIAIGADVVFTESDNA